MGTILQVAGVLLAVIAQNEKPAFRTEELDQMLAPIAIYPDALLSQILMASTYPLEVVRADRWVKAHKDLKGDAAAKALEQETWDASVKSLVNFPDVLSMMSDKLDWTEKLGNAFLAQQNDVMEAVQRLRVKAKDAGNLKSSKEQVVEVRTEESKQVIVIESASPTVIYVPACNPTIVYGTWPYPAYPPYPYYPPGYVAASSALWFGAGVACGVAWGYAWGHCNWGHNDVNVNINQNNQYNNFINKQNYQRVGQGGSGTWQHDPSHRQSVPYRNQAVAQKYGGVSADQATKAREQYRGRSAGTANPGMGNPGAAKPATANPGSGTRSGAFEGMGGSGREASGQAQRGRQSMGGGARSGGGGRGGRR